MPQQFYTTAYCNSAATTNYYVPTWTSNNASNTITITNNGWYYPTQTTTAAYTDRIWQQWVTYTYPQTSWVQTPTHAYRESREQRVARELQELARNEERQAARTRARVLLGEFLSDEQKVELERQGRFHVTGSKGRRYCIRTAGQQGNVDLLKPDGEVQATLCCHPRGALPDGDAWLMQMVEIRHDEDHFLATANVHRGRLPAGVR